jgi:hypothetical protein
MKLKKTVSDAVRQKNQQNSKKSTGPNTPQGKIHSRFNAVKHGLTSRLLMYDQNGDPIDGGVAEMIEALRDRYGADNIVAELLIDNIAADFWRQNKGLEAELSFFSQGRWAFYPQDSLPTIQRYNTTNRHGLLKNLELLEKLCPVSQSSQLSAEANNPQDCLSPVDDQDTSIPAEEPCTIDEAHPQEVGSAVLESEPPDASHSEERTDGKGRPIVDADLVEGDSAA